MVAVKGQRDFNNLGRSTQKNQLVECEEQAELIASRFNKGLLVLLLIDGGCVAYVLV